MGANENKVCGIKLGEPNFAAFRLGVLQTVLPLHRPVRLVNTVRPTHGIDTTVGVEGRLSPGTTLGLKILTNRSELMTQATANLPGVKFVVGRWSLVGIRVLAIFFNVLSS